MSRSIHVIYRKVTVCIAVILIAALVFPSPYAFGAETTAPVVAAASDELTVATEDPVAPTMQAAVGATAESNEIRIKSVEVLTQGEFQSIYRESVYKGRGLETYGEDPAKWYTTYREFNLKDPRIFNLEFSVPKADVEDTVKYATPAAYLSAIRLNYGGVPIGDWGNGVNLRGTTDIIVLLNTAGYEPSIVADGDTYKVSMSLRVTSPWASSDQSVASNIPFTGYFGGSQGNFGSGQTADNRAYWQAGPTYKGMGTYKLEALVDAATVAEKEIHIGPYDEMRSWIEMNEWAQSLVKAINGQPIPIADLNEKPIGTLAKGYVATDKDGNFVPGNRLTDVYVEVAIIGYGLTDNARPENATFNNYSRYNPIWNIAVAYDENTVNTYLNDTVPTMNENPQKLIDKYKDAADDDIDMINVYYQNNVHPDEVTGSDSELKLIYDLIDGKKAGKTIDYKTWKEEDYNLRYRVPTTGYQTSTSSHQLKDAYTGRFTNPTARTDASFDTGDALEELIFVTNITSNPDGRAGMRRVNRYGLDLNRDAVYATQPETIALIKDLTKWDPLVMNEWHGYVAQMLIEPCTAPHDPNYEYDLMQNNMLQLAYKAGYAVTANTGYANFRIPWDNLAGGAWDDGGTIYGPMWAMLLGTYGYTIEFPHSNTDSYEAGNVINYAMVNELLAGETRFYVGNKLNGPLLDVNGETRDSHAVDNKYASMRKSSVLNKLEVKRRGLENIDSMAADKYFIDNRTVNGSTAEVVVGRPRPVDKNGDDLPFFPDYVVIPTDADNQYNVAEGIKGINQMLSYGIKVGVSTEDIQYNGKTIKKGAYVFDMRQGRRNVIQEVMGKGYDATGFPSMYADIYCNLPDVRGFDSLQIYGKGLYDGKLTALDNAVAKRANISGLADDYVVFKSQSTDAVRFVNLLLSGKSSGPSTAEKGNVWMLRKAVDGVGNASDYVIETKDLSKITKLVDNPNLGLLGCQIEGQYISDLPKEAVKLVEPVIQFNTERTAQSGGVLWWALDDYLGFGSMSDYNGTTGNNIRTGANVVVSNNATPGSAILNAVKNQKLGLVLIQSAAALTNANFGTGTAAAPTTSSFSDVALNGTYNVDDSLFTQNYANTTTIYARGNRFTGNIPAGSKILFRSLPDGQDAFIGGWQNTGGAKTAFGNATTMFSTILKGGGITGKPVQALVIGQNMHNRSHYQKLLPVLATGIYAGAAGILDDFNAPKIDVALTGLEFTVSATEATGESGIDGNLVIYRWDDTDKKYVTVYDGANTTFSFTVDATSGQEFKAVAKDYAGNEAVKYFYYSDLFLKTALQLIVDQYVNSFPEADYTPSSWKPLGDAIDAAKAIIAAPLDFTDDDVYAAMDALVAAEGGLVRIADKSALKAIIDYAADMLKPANIEKYIPASVANLQTALASANAVYADIEADQTKVDVAYNDLLAAIGKMYEKGDKAGLKALVSLVSRYVPTTYTPASWATFLKALEDAQKVLDDPNAIVDSVDKAYTALRNAITGLTRRADFATLNASIAIAQKIVDNIGDYVPSTVIGFAEELDKAKSVTANATQAEVNAAAAALNAKILAARLKPDLSGLLSAMTRAKALDANSYTETSYKVLSTAVTGAEAVLRTPDEVTQTDVDGAAQAVNSAIDGLVSRPSATVSGNDEKTTAPDAKTAIPKVKVQKITVSGKGKVVIKWTKASAALKIKGYQVQYRVKGTAKWKTKTVSAKSASLTIKSLKKNKQYQFRVRAYRVNLPTKEYSPWSAVKTSKKL